MGLSWPAYTNWGSKKPRSFNCFCVIVKRWIRPEKSWILMDGHKWYLCGITEMWWKHQCNGTWVTTPGEEWCGLGCSARCCGNLWSQRAGNQHCHCGSGEAVMRGSRTSALLWARPRPAATTVCLLQSIPSCSSLLALGHPAHPAVPWAAISTGLCPPGGRVLSVLEHPIRLVGFSTGKQLM